MVDASGRVLEALAGRRARFVPEVAYASRVSGSDLETTLSELEASGRVLVREQVCADPHLEGTDLRLVALIDGDVSDAVSAIDARWQAWLAEYLANHRCG